jgi:hypothetical protein
VASGRIRGDLTGVSTTPEMKKDVVVAVGAVEGGDNQKCETISSG